MSGESGNPQLPVSVVIPLHHGNGSIADTLNSILRQSIPPEEILLILNDSEQNNVRNFSLILKQWEMIPLSVPSRVRRCGDHEIPYRAYGGRVGNTRIFVYMKKLSSKADALNAGITYASGTLVATIDADTVLRSDCLEKLEEPFRDEHTIAAGGCVLPMIEPGKELTKIQYMEYVQSFSTARFAADSIHANILLSGALSMFRRDVLYANPFACDTIGEDFEIVLRLNHLIGNHRRDYRICYVESAVCLTSTPWTIARLFRQRIRWHIGLVQTLTRHKAMLFRPSYGTVGLVALPCVLFLEFLPPYFLPIVTIRILVLLLTNGWGLPCLTMGIPVTVYILVEIIISIIGYDTMKHRVCMNQEQINLLTAFLGELLLLLLIKPILNLAKVVATIGYPLFRKHWL